MNQNELPKANPYPTFDLPGHITGVTFYFRCRMRVGLSENCSTPYDVIVSREEYANYEQFRAAIHVQALKLKALKEWESSLFSEDITRDMPEIWKHLECPKYPEEEL